MSGALENRKVVLIDGSGYIYRAFYALPPMTRGDGTPVNAVYGFCAMLMKLIKEMPADYLAVMFDTSRQTFRMDIFPDYKGTRKETPEELIPQFPLLRLAVDAFGIAQAEMEGYEADDLLATYARLAHQEEAEVTIVSADKDLMQLVGSGVTIYDPMKQRVVEAEQVMEKFGVTPDKVVDVQALAGDTSDNVPGVRGIGIKTAAALINEYGTLENLLDNVSYVDDAGLNQSAYSALVGKESVCAGYARAFQYLMLKLGIPCYTCVGEANGEDHAWNIVIIDGIAYNVDVAWDDPESGNVPGEMSYYNVSGNIISLSHTRKGMSEKLPQTI